MKTNEKKNTSAKKKLIPAVAMLTTSAVMLSTATYAWFTMNKDAEVTGLNMTATAGGSIEISLGQIDNASGLPVASASDPDVVKTPDMSNKSWKNVIAVSDYYSSIAKIKPASSIDAKSIYYVDDDKVYAAGTAVDDSTKVTKTNADNEVELKLRTVSGTSLDTAADDNTKDYRYLDIPVWIRTTKQETQEIKCDVTITDKTTDSPVKGSDLRKAVKVAIIPVSDNDASVTSTASATDVTEAPSYSVAKTVSVFGIGNTTSEMYTSGQALSMERTTVGENAKYSDVLGNISYTQTTALSEDKTDKTASSTTIFELAPTTAEKTYSVQGFVVRVWLEGESIYCNDATAAQDWNIQLNFTGTDKQ